MKRYGLLTVTVGVFLGYTSIAGAAVRYVKPAASGTGDCATWANACTLPSALDGAQSGDQIWVMSGTYAPLALKNGVKIIGGFAGWETTASQSDPTTNLSIIDGGGTAQCVTGSDNSPSTVVRGFTIRNGRDTGDEGGGGMVLNNSSALIVQCIFENNKAGYFGGAVSVRGTGSPHFVNCIFRNNGDANGSNPLAGGAVFASGGSSNFTNCLFHGNKAGEAGAILVRSGAPTFINCTLVNNHATITYGGAFYDQDGRIKFRNCILWGNSTTRGVGYADQGYSGSGGTTQITYSNVQGGWVGTGNINADPLFQYPESKDYKLQSGSPCKDVGENVALPQDVGNLDWDMDTDEMLPLDLALFNRIWNGIVDMGAYEYFEIESPE